MSCFFLHWIAVFCEVFLLCSLSTTTHTVCTPSKKCWGYTASFKKHTLHLSSCLSLCPSVFISVCLSASVFYLSVYFGLFIYLSVSLPASLSVCLLSSVCLWYEPTGILLILFVTHTHTHTHTYTQYQYLLLADSLQTELSKWIKLVWTVLKLTLADLVSTHKHTHSPDMRVHTYTHTHTHTHPPTNKALYSHKEQIKNCRVDGQTLSNLFRQTSFYCFSHLTS